MMTLRQLAATPPTLPMRATWYLTDRSEARGKQELFTHQSPQKPKVLRDHALVESAVASNRIGGVDLIRHLLARLEKEKKIKALGTGRGAKWTKTGN